MIGRRGGSETAARRSSSSTAAAARAGRRLRRRHAAKVALTTAAITALLGLLAGLTLDLVVLRRLQGQADARLGDRLRAAAAGAGMAGGAGGPAGAGDAGAGRSGGPGGAPPPDGGRDDGVHPDGDGDFDDAPALLWKVAADGVVTPTSTAQPTLPARQWKPGTVTTLDLGGQQFRVEALAAGSGWYVAAQSTGPVERVRDELVVTELVLGAAMVAAVYFAALVIGLRASAPVEEIRRRQAEFTADASHELRTPLAVIQAEVGLALERPRSGAYYEETLGRVAGESSRLRSIVDDLLWLARSDAGTETPPLSLVDMGAVASSAVNRFGALARERNITLDLVHADAGVVQAPEEWAERLLGVLVDNACKYAERQVLVQVRLANGSVILTVDDDGPGVPIEERGMVLDRFHRATDQQGGTGLGLAIADSVVRTTGGEWLIGDAPLGGARFRVTWRASGGVQASPLAGVAPG